MTAWAKLPGYSATGCHVQHKNWTSRQSLTCIHLDAADSYTCSPSRFITHPTKLSAAPCYLPKCHTFESQLNARTRAVHSSMLRSNPAQNTGALEEADKHLHHCISRATASRLKCTQVHFHHFWHSPKCRDSPMSQMTMISRRAACTWFSCSCSMSSISCSTCEGHAQSAETCRLPLGPSLLGQTAAHLYPSCVERNRCAKAPSGLCWGLISSAEGHVRASRASRGRPPRVPRPWA